MTANKPSLTVPALAGAMVVVLLGTGAPGAAAAERLWNSEIQRDLLPDKPKADVAAPKRAEQASSKPERRMRFDFDLPAERPMVLLPNTPSKGSKDDRKDEEKRDQKRNWIFVDPEKAAQAASGADEEEDEEPTPEEALLPYKGVMQQFMEAGSSGAETARGGDAGERREAAVREPRSLDLSVTRDLDVAPSEPGDSASDGDTRLSRPFFGGNTAPQLPPPPSAGLGGTAVPPGFGTASSSSGGADERQLRDQQFQGLLRGSAFSSQPSGAAPGFGSSPATSSLRDYGSSSGRSSGALPGGFNSSPSGSGALMVPGAARGIAPAFGGAPLSPARPSSPAFSTVPSYAPPPASERALPTMAPAILPGPGGQRRF